ncbi:MAG: tRNA pseudouridine(38-40) synthase TruA [Bacteroidetes bacterium]|nr:tRNA pseudouridine(38-40) synthase TruA [Bacteroidota bacterium]
MARYFIEVAYKGTGFSGFQAQENANTIQSELERGLAVLHRFSFSLTGSSRTDAGVHAEQNFFHFDCDSDLHPQLLYKLNAILPADVVVKNFYRVSSEAHCRFDAVSRQYGYRIYRQKNPFLADRSYYFPYTLNVDRMQEAAAMLMGFTDFTSFSKRNTQVKHFDCRLEQSGWVQEGEEWVYRVQANRFLRGMVRALTSTMLLVGREKIDLYEFQRIIESKNCERASFALPAHGLFLEAVTYPDGLLTNCISNS